jgi:hypothetical protein
MCIVFTCGEHTFRKEVEGYHGQFQCFNCGNYAGSVIKSNPWFTFCFIVSQLFRGRAWSLAVCRSALLPPLLKLSHPLTRLRCITQPVIPLSIKGHEDIICRICNFAQPLENRPEVQALRGQLGQGVQMQPPPPGNPQGWGGQGPKPNGPMTYG